MKNLARGAMLVAAFALLWLVPSGFAQIQVALNPSLFNNPNYYGEPAAPYASYEPNGTQLSLICDDFHDDQNVGSYYQYNVVNYSSITYGSGTNVLFGNISNAFGTPQQLYGAAAWLMQQLVLQTSAVNQGAYTFAIWAVFDPSAVMSQIGAGGEGFNWSDVTGLIATALADYSHANLSDVSFLVPVGCAGQGLSGCSQGGGGVQEFGMVPEGGAAAMYLLLAGVTCFGAMFYSRRQSAMGGLA